MGYFYFHCIQFFKLKVTNQLFILQSKVQYLHSGHMISSPIRYEYKVCVRYLRYLLKSKQLALDVSLPFLSSDLEHRSVRDAL